MACDRVDDGFASLMALDTLKDLKMFRSFQRKFAYRNGAPEHAYKGEYHKEAFDGPSDRFILCLVWLIVSETKDGHRKRGREERCILSCKVPYHRDGGFFRGT